MPIPNSLEVKVSNMVTDLHRTMVKFRIYRTSEGPLTEFGQQTYNRILVGTFEVGFDGRPTKEWFVTALKEYMTKINSEAKLNYAADKFICAL